MKSLTITAHRGESHLPRVQQCPQREPQCNVRHWNRQVPVNQPGSWSVMELLSNKSAVNVLKAYGRMKSKRA